MLEHIGGDQAIELTEAERRRGGVIQIGDDHPVQPRLGVTGIGAIKLDSDHLGALALLERRPQRAGAAAEIEDPGGGPGDERGHLGARVLVGAGTAAPELRAGGHRPIIAPAPR